MGNHPPIPYKNYLLDPISFLHFSYFIGDHLGILRIAGEYLHTHRAPLGTAKQPYHHLLMPPLAVPVISEFNKLTVFILALNIAAGYIVEHKRAPSKMLCSQCLLNGILPP